MEPDLTGIDQGEFIVQQVKPGLASVYERNPDETLGRLYGLSWDTAPAPLKGAAETTFGPKPPPPPPQPPFVFGEAGKFYVMKVNYTDPDGNPAQRTVISGPGPFTISPSSGGTGNGFQITNYNGTRGDGQQFALQVYHSIGSTPTLVCTESGGSGQPVDPSNPVEYPPLDEDDLALIDSFVAALAAINNLRTGGTGGISKDLQAQLTRTLPDIPVIKTGIEGVDSKVGDITNQITELEQDLQRITQTVTSVLDCTCGVSVNNCDDLPIAGLGNVLQLLTDLACRIYEAQGYQGEPLDLDTDPPKRIKSNREAFEEAFRRLGFTRPTQFQQCGENQEVADVQDALGNIQESLGLQIPIRTGETNVDGGDVTSCNLGGVLSALAARGADEAFFVGFPGDRPPVSILKVRFAKPDRNASSSSIQIPAPIDDPDKDRILAAIGPRTAGPWLCTLQLENGYKLYSWHETKEAGEPYLLSAATLSRLEVNEGSFAATYNPQNAPVSGAGVVVYPLSAVITYPKGSLLRPRRIRLR